MQLFGIFITLVLSARPPSVGTATSVPLPRSPAASPLPSTTVRSESLSTLNSTRLESNTISSNTSETQNLMATATATPTPNSAPSATPAAKASSSHRLGISPLCTLLVYLQIVDMLQ